MYSLDINFLQDRPSHQKKSEKKVASSSPAGSLIPLFIGLAIGLSLPLFAGVGWYFLTLQNSQLEEQNAQLEGENQELEARIGSIKAIRQEINKIKGENQALASVFNKIRPWSAILQDLRDRIPNSVQINDIEQVAPQIEDTETANKNTAGAINITGLARSPENVNDFLLGLQQSRLFDASGIKIISAEEVDAPIPPEFNRSSEGIEVRASKAIKYIIKANLSEIPASELLRELEQKGTVGIVARIRNLQRTGVLQNDTK
ncbi:MAG: PilN domain-containing protein [Cyanobacteria bacterium P01_A01_bin.84]